MVSAASKKRRRQEGQRRKKAERVEVPLPTLDTNEPEVEVVALGLDEDDRNYAQFKQAFERLQGGPDAGAAAGVGAAGSDADSSDDGEEYMAAQARSHRMGDEGDDDDAARRSKKELRRAGRLTVAQLKQSVAHPELVEVHDPNSREPHLLIDLKATHNAVTIPQHWCQKRKYLSMKKASTKPPFELPSFIAELGVGRTRKAFLDREADKKERRAAGGVRTKITRVDIRYDEYERAFRKPARPPLSEFGEMYYEGREKETKNKFARPGQVSQRLRNALGMPEGYPPPWLIGMQKYGPPRSYPNLKVPGLTSPLPIGAQWGYHPGGWGKAPVDERGNPLYGDVFGKPTDKAHEEAQYWGVMDDDESSDAEDYDEPMEEAPEQPEVEEAAAPVAPPPPAAVVREVAAEAPSLVDIGGGDGDAGDRQAFRVLKQTAGQEVARGVIAPSFGYDLAQVLDCVALCDLPHTRSPNAT